MRAMRLPRAGIVAMTARWRSYFLPLLAIGRHCPWAFHTVTARDGRRQIAAWGSPRPPLTAISRFICAATP